MNKLTKEQKKIIVAVFIGVISVIGFLVFIYGPKNKQLMLIKKDLEFTESQITEIKEVVRGKELSEAVKDLSTQFFDALSLLSARQEDLIAGLSKKARSLNVEIKSINPKAKRLLDDKVLGYNIEELPIAMVLSCGFRDLGEYSNILRNNLPMFVKVKEIRIRGQGEGKPILDVSLEILAYLASPKL